jgi:SRSO17 transposase
MKDQTAPSTTKAPPPAKPAPAGARKSDPKAGERLAAALRENLRRRKQQAKARRSDAGPGEGQAQD